MSPNVAETNNVPSDSRNPVVKFEHPNCQLCTSKNLPYLFSKIRHVETVPKDFEFYSLRLMKLIAEDALALMADKEVDIPTPCGTWRGVAADPESEAFAVSIVRAGDSMLQAVRELVPGIPVAKILIQRDETTKEKTPILYYKKWPKNVANKTALICDPMLATGGSVIMAIKSLLEIGIPEEKMIFVNVISCPEGLNRLGREYPNVKVVTGMVDPMLNSDRFIVPGLGDYGDRFFGTVE